MDWPARRLVTIDNRAICARVMGEGPTVVLEAGGAGEGSNEDFGGVLEERLAAFATVLTYDRAGSGRSDGPPHRSVAGMADDLQVLIRSLRCTTPVVIVGWSAGGLVAEMFAARHPDQVAGLVLLDPSEMATESGVVEFFGLIFNFVWSWVLGLVLLTGLPRTRIGHAAVSRMAPKDIRHWLYRYLDNHRWAGLQTARIIPRLGRYVRETKAALDCASLPDVPVRVLIPQPRPGWLSLNAKLDAAHHKFAARFARGGVVPVAGTSHQWLPIERPDAVIAAVRDVLASDTETQWSAT